MISLTKSEPSFLPGKTLEVLTWGQIPAESAKADEVGARGAKSQRVTYLIVPQIGTGDSWGERLSAKLLRHRATYYKAGRAQPLGWHEPSHSRSSSGSGERSSSSK